MGSMADRSTTDYINPKYITPLPRLTPASPSHDASVEIGDKYEVIVIGAGPTGLLLSTHLTRYNLSSVLTIDAKTGPITTGHADGFNGRSLEILASLGLHHEIYDLESRFAEVRFWGPAPDGKGGLVRSGAAPMRNRPTRFGFTCTVGQAHVERVLNKDLASRGNPVRYGWKFVSFSILEAKEHGDFPVEIKIQSTIQKNVTKTVYAKYLVGADGAHSAVRTGMGIPMEGSGTDDIWGVVDSVVKTDFPDSRRACPIVSPSGSILWIPRERISPSQSLTRVYVQLATTASDGSAAADSTVASTATTTSDNYTRYSAETYDATNATLAANGSGGSNGSNGVAGTRSATKALRLKATLEDILARIPAIIHPYKFEAGYIDWWASYQIGQRMTPSYTFPPSTGSSSPRVLIAGDACHTHSPKAGQGANFGMADAQNLAWKLVYAIHGLVPDGDMLVKSYEVERLQAARRLIEFDKKWSKLFTGSVTLEEAGLRPEQWMRIINQNLNFVGGFGILYPPSFLVGQEKDAEKREHMDDVLRPGRVLCSTSFAHLDNGIPVDSQDAMYSSGKFRVVVLLPESASSSTTETWWPDLDALLTSLQAGVLASVVETVIVHPWLATKRDTEWTDFPPSVRKFAERTVYGEAEKGCVYGIWGIERDKGALAVVRPDGYVGTQCEWADVEGVINYFSGIFGNE